MNYEIIVKPTFQREAKRLAKHYSSFKEDFVSLIDDLWSRPYPRQTADARTRPAPSHGGADRQPDVYKRQAVKHTAACEKSYISGVIRKSTEKPYFQKALPGAVSAWYLAGFIHISVWRLETTANERKLGLSARWFISRQSRRSGRIKAGRCSSLSLIHI